MNYRCKISVAFLLVLVLLVPLSLSCGGGGQPGVVTIKIGEIIDFTGPGAPAVISLHRAMVDLVKYYNNEGLIPGAKLKLISYDCQDNPARDILGYDWCKEQGAEVIFAVHPTTPITVRPFAERDKVPIATVSYTDAAAEPPGWVFIFSASTNACARTLLKWLSEYRWDYTRGIPKVGFFGWSEPMALGTSAAIEQYCQAKPDKFDYVGTFLAPFGSLTSQAEIQALKDCDYIYVQSIPAGAFIRDYHAKGYDRATFIGDASNVGYYDFFVNVCGWEALNGMITTNIAPWWNEPNNHAVAFIKEVIDRYHPGVVPEDIGASYEGGFFLILSFFEVVRQAVQEAGLENFDGQAFYNAAVKFNLTFEGLPPAGFTQTSRVFVNQVAMHEWRAEVKSMVRISDWMPVVE